MTVTCNAVDISLGGRRGFLMWMDLKCPWHDWLTLTLSWSNDFPCDWTDFSFFLCLPSWRKEIFSWMMEPLKGEIFPWNSSSYCITIWWSSWWREECCLSSGTIVITSQKDQGVKEEMVIFYCRPSFGVSCYLDQLCPIVSHVRHFHCDPVMSSVPSFIIISNRRPSEEEIKSWTVSQTTLFSPKSVFFMFMSVILFHVVCFGKDLGWSFFWEYKSGDFRSQWKMIMKSRHRDMISRFLMLPTWVMSRSFTTFFKWHYYAKAEDSFIFWRRL